MSVGRGGGRGGGEWGSSKVPNDLLENGPPRIAAPVLKGGKGMGVGVGVVP